MTILDAALDSARGVAADVTETRVGRLTEAEVAPDTVEAGNEEQTFTTCPLFWHLLHVASHA